MIFIDTGFFFALVSKKDEHHRRAREIFVRLGGERLWDKLLTTNHVVAETLTLTRGLGHEKAVRLGERLYAGEARPHSLDDTGRGEAAFAFFKQRADKDYSLFDCLSFIVMKKLRTS